MPDWEPAGTGDLPEGIYGPDEECTATGTEDHAGKNVTRIMDAVVDSGKTDQQRQVATYEANTLPVIDESDQGGAKPVGGVRRWCMLKLSPRPTKNMSINNSMERSQSADRMFDGVADDAVAQSQTERQGCGADASSGTAFDNQRDQRGNKNQREERRVAEERWKHGPVEQRVADRRINEMKQ